MRTYYCRLLMQRRVPLFDRYILIREVANYKTNGLPKDQTLKLPRWLGIWENGNISINYF